MKKGFTLVEMLIVVVVLVTLMSMVFKLGSISGSSSKRNTTIARLQRLENCLSGYYAAFGTYPPVAPHADGNPFLKVSDEHGMQNRKGEENRDIWNWDVEKFKRGDYQEEEDKAWRQCEAACKAQPVGCEFPYPDGYGEFVDAHSDMLKTEAANSSSLTPKRKQVFAAGFDDGVSRNIGRFSQYQDKVDWRDLQLFKFGLLSFLLPRYLVMMGSDESLYEDFAQWTSNNKRPRNPLNDSLMTWKQVRDWSLSNSKTDNARVANVASQAVCARWIPNLEGIVYSPHTIKVFGVDLRDKSDGGFSTKSEIHSPGSYDDESTSGQYVLDFCTVRDGWWNTFYYYSPPPYQSYVLWSPGPNGRTFPPWISREDLGADANKCIGAWIEDDIVNMSH